MSLFHAETFLAIIIAFIRPLHGYSVNVSVTVSGEYSKTSFPTSAPTTSTTTTASPTASGDTIAPSPSPTTAAPSTGSPTLSPSTSYTDQVIYAYEQRIKTFVDDNLEAYASSCSSIDHEVNWNADFVASPALTSATSPGTSVTPTSPGTFNVTLDIYLSTTQNMTEMSDCAQEIESNKAAIQTAVVAEGNNEQAPDTNGYFFKLTGFSIGNSANSLQIGMIALFMTTALSIMLL